MADARGAGSSARASGDAKSDGEPGKRAVREDGATCTMESKRHCHRAKGAHAAEGDDDDAPDAVPLLPPRSLDTFPKEWWIHLVRYFKMYDLAQLHQTCRIIRAYELQAKCLYICVRCQYQLELLNRCQTGVERVIVQWCFGLHDPTKVTRPLGACRSLKAWHFQQEPRGLRRPCSSHLTSTVQVEVSQLAHLQQFLQQQRRYVASARTRRRMMACGRALQAGEHRVSPFLFVS